MAKGDTTRANKRKFGSGKGSPYAHTRRGPPAIFVSCESGREKKCQREALELMHHYYYLTRENEKNDTTTQQQSNDDINAVDDDQHITNNEANQQQEELSLEEELSLLRKGVMAEEVLTYDRNSKRQKVDNKTKNKVSAMKSPFSAYESGVRGMICLICNLPGSEVIPYDEIVAKIHADRKERTENETSSTHDLSDDKEACAKEEIDNQAVKKIDGETNPSSAETALWDPIDTVKRIMEGVTEERNATNTSKSFASPPSSRFISRMLPMQATCYASVDEIKLVTTSLLQTYLPPIIQNYKSADSCATITFKLDVKRRLCSHLNRDQVIEAITPILLGSGNSTEDSPEKKYGCKFSVNLSDPDFAIRIEVIKTLCGISILPRQQWYRNFNLAELIDEKDNDKNN